MVELLFYWLKVLVATEAGDKVVGASLHLDNGAGGLTVCPDTLVALLTIGLGQGHHANENSLRCEEGQLCHEVLFNHLKREII